MPTLRASGRGTTEQEKSNNSGAKSGISYRTSPCLPDSLTQYFGVEFELPRESQDIVEILHPTIQAAEMNYGLNLFGNDHLW